MERKLDGLQVFLEVEMTRYIFNFKIYIHTYTRTYIYIHIYIYIPRSVYLSLKYFILFQLINILYNS